MESNFFGAADYEEQKQTEEQLAWQRYEEGRQAKQQYLWDEIANKGFDTTAFAQYMEYKKADGTNIDNWTYEEIKEVVADFVQDALKTNQHEEVEESKQRQSYVEPQDEEQFENLVNPNKALLDETLPKVKTRGRAPTAKLVPTQINNKKITIKVVDSQVKKGGFFSSDYILYCIQTEPLGWATHRRDSEFYTLRIVMRNQFPHMVIPPLPIVTKKMTRKALDKREKQFQRFLQAISRSEELKSSLFLQSFLNITDLKEWQKAVKVFEKTKFGKSLHDLVTQDGDAPVTLIQNSSVFATKMQSFADSYQILYQEIIDTTLELNEKSQELAATMYSLGKFLEQLSEVNRMIKCERQQELFVWLSKMMTGTGNHVANLGDLIKVYLGSHLKYHKDEHESYRELLVVREAVKNGYIKKEKALFERKEKMFRNKDFTRWQFVGSQDELVRRQEQITQNKDVAFRFMLTDETQQLEMAREELAFYTNQCLAEVRRVGADNGELLTNHFITMSQIQCAYINQHHVMWADFLSHFTEIGNLDEQHIIKQRPYVPSQAQPNLMQAEQQQQFHQQQPQAYPEPAKEHESSNWEGSSGMSKDGGDHDNEEETKNTNKNFERRNTKLDSEFKFQGALDKINTDLKTVQDSKPKKRDSLSKIQESPVKESDVLTSPEKKPNATEVKSDSEKKEEVSKHQQKEEQEGGESKV